MGQVTAISAKYIKLGENGRWDALCLKDGTLRLAYNDVPHSLGTAGKTALKDHFIGQGFDSGPASNHANQVNDFYQAGQETLWITFSSGHLWWAIAEGPVEFLGGNDAEMKERGSRLRRTRNGWHKTSLDGVPLRMSDLNGALTKTAGYRMAICNIGPLDYLLRKINDEDLLEIEQAKQAKVGILKSIKSLMHLLQWKDFELLVELVFAQSGWRQISSAGGTKETVDLELELPSTGERSFVQVKSRTSQSQLDDYLSRFKARDECRMFFVYHTAKSALTTHHANVTLIDAERLSEMILESGLFDWLLKKVG